MPPSITVAPAVTKTAGTEGKQTPELRKPRTTFKVPVPVILVELQGISDKSTLEGKKKYEAFVGKPAKNRSTSSTPLISALKSTPANSKILVKGKTTGGGSTDTNNESITIQKTSTKNAKPTPDKAKTGSSEDEVMEDAPPLSKRASVEKSPSPVSSNEATSSESEEDSDEDSDEEEEEAKSTPKKTPPAAEKKPAKSGPIALTDSGSEPETEPQGRFVDVKALMELSDSDQDRSESLNQRGSRVPMTREESPIKGPGKRQLRSSSPEKKSFVQFSYATAPSKLALEPISKLAPEASGGTPSSDEEDEADDGSDQEMADPGEEAETVEQTDEGDEEEEEEEEDEEYEEDDYEDDEGLVAGKRRQVIKLPKTKAVKIQVPQSESDNEPEPDKTRDKEPDSELELGPGSERPKSRATAEPSPSISVVPESSQIKPQSQQEAVAKDDTKTATAASDDDDSSSEEESSEEESSEDEPEKATPPKKVDTTAKAMNALFRSPAPRLLNGNPQTTPSRFSKTPEPSQPTAGPSKLPPSRMNRRTLGYISPSPGPPSSMPARLPSMMSPKDVRKRHSLNSHYKGLTMLSQQDIPETRDGKTAKPAAAAAVGVGPGQKSKPRLSEGMKSFQSILSSQKGGKDSDDDSDSDDSDDSEDEGKAKEEEKTKGRTGSGRFLPFL
ncbi:hypothetical protein TWF481_002908 [Arthrobotrys musiformis]|uniref:Uncharacterized protein n=1 Tax=Arthrobotrys musiformis TaxID=47236 RepID=A0AAV9VRT4_9PEZI